MTNRARTYEVSTDALPYPSTLIGYITARMSNEIPDRHAMLAEHVAAQAAWYNPTVAAMLEGQTSPNKYKKLVSSMEYARATLIEELVELISEIGPVEVKTGQVLPANSPHLEGARVLAAAGVTFVPPLPPRLTHP